MDTAFELVVAELACYREGRHRPARSPGRLPRRPSAVGLEEQAFGLRARRWSGSRSSMPRASSVLASTMSARALPSTAWRTQPARIGQSGAVGESRVCRALGRSGRPLPGWRRRRAPDRRRQRYGARWPPSPRRRGRGAPARLDLPTRGTRAAPAPWRATNVVPGGASSARTSSAITSWRTRPHAAGLDQQAGGDQPPRRLFSQRCPGGPASACQLTERCQPVFGDRGGTGGGCGRVRDRGGGGRGRARATSEVGVITAAEPFIEQQRMPATFVPNPRTRGHRR